MSGLHPGFIAGDLDKTVGQALGEIAEYDRQEKEAIAAQEEMEETERNNEAEGEIPPKIALSAFEEKRDVINEHPFKPVSAEEQKKGAAMYAQLLLMKVTAKKRMMDSVDMVIKLQKVPSAQHSAAAYAFWKRQMLLGRV